MKSAEEILKEELSTDHPEWIENNPNIVPDITQAMHTYALQQAVEFAEWVAPYNYYGKGIWVGFDDVQYTTSDLYKLFTQQKQK